MKRWWQWTVNGGPSCPLTLTVRLGMQMAELAVTSPICWLPGLELKSGTFSNPSARVFSIEFQFPVLFCQTVISIHFDFSTLWWEEAPRSVNVHEKWVSEANCISAAFSVLLIRRRHYKWKLSQRMFMLGSAAPPASVGDTHIAHSLTGTGGCMALPCQHDGNGGGGGWGLMKGLKGEWKKGGTERRMEIENKTRNKLNRAKTRWVRRKLVEIQRALS